MVGDIPLQSNLQLSLLYGDRNKRGYFESDCSPGRQEEGTRVAGSLFLRGMAVIVCQQNLASP